MKTTTVTPAVGRVAALDAAKAHARIGHGAEDALVTDLIDAATARVEIETGLALLTRTLRLDLPAWNGFAVHLRPAPVTALVSVTSDGEDITGDFALEFGRPATVCRKPGASGARAGQDMAITYTAGFGAAEDVPEDLVLAVKLLVTELYNGRDGNAPVISPRVAELVKPWREMRL